MNVFDLDGTLITSNSSFALLRQLHKSSLISTSDFIFSAKTYGQYLCGFLSLHSLYEKIFHRLQKRLSFSELEKGAKIVAEELLQTKLNKAVIHEIEELQKKKASIFLLSSSPHFLVSYFAHALNLTSFEGSHLENRNSGAGFLILTGEAKLQKVKQLFGCKQIERVYSDSHEDLPLMEAAVMPVAVRPTRKLKSIAQKRGWKILL